jgi:acyl-coenzyme A synthetase/AMP-(fatty) acid ligase
LNKFCCPACRISLAYRAQDETGYLTCTGCGVSFPLVDGIAYFDQPTLSPFDIVASGEKLREHLLGSVSDYHRFIEAKHQRPMVDAYAAFQPFNESTRALYCLFDEIKTHVKKGEPILDLWGRTGFSGESLAAYFPDNPVYMLWEGDKNVLGHKGYHYWLSQGARAGNLHIVFTDLEKPLPFADDFFGLVHGLDSLHRYAPSPLISECFRVSKASAPIIFPHIHLTNNEPEPWFERGCTQYHGKVYRQLMNRILASHQRESYLLSEKVLFEMTQPCVVSDDHDMEHYNALLYIAPAGVKDSILKPCEYPAVEVGGSTQVIVNPLLNIDSISGEVSIDRKAMAGLSQHLLERHPVYEARLNALLPMMLNDTDRQLLFCVDQAMSLTQIAQRLSLSFEEIDQRLQFLQEHEVCTYLNISPAMARLQNFYRTQSLVHPLRHEKDFRVVWQALGACAGNNKGEECSPMFISTAQGIEYDRADVDEAVQMIHWRLTSMNCQPGDRIMICADQHPAYLLTVWAAWLSGITVVPVCPQTQQDNLRYMLDLIKPVAVFIDSNIKLPEEGNFRPVVFDPLGDSPINDDRQVFSEWLDMLDEEVLDQPLAYQQVVVAVILFSSGTTGRPKAILHSLANLLAGSIKLTSFYDLKKQSRLLSVGGFHTMSGLRNAAVLPLVNKQTLLLADTADENKLIQLLRVSADYQPNIVFSTPALVNALDKLRGKLEEQDFASIAVWLCTGASVSARLLSELSASLDIQFENYYGLTETGGVCAGTLNSREPCAGNIGYPMGAIVKVVNAAGYPCQVNASGYMLVFSDQLMLGYLGTDGRSVDASAIESNHGWQPTKDSVGLTASSEIILHGRGYDEFSTAAGELLNLNQLELQLKDAGMNEEFALTHDEGKLLVVLEAGDKKPQQAPDLLIAALRSAQFEAINEFDIYYIDELPRTSNGKIQRALLSKLMKKQMQTRDVLGKQ